MINPNLMAVLLLTLSSAMRPDVALAREKSGRGPIVKACSPYGNGCVAGPVRAAKFGPQVRLKSGTWIDCKGDCGQALLEETIDFWDSQSDKAMILSR